MCAIFNLKIIYDDFVVKLFIYIKKFIEQVWSIWGLVELKVLRPFSGMIMSSTWKFTSRVSCGLEHHT